jgi:hypothetical protein
MMPYHDGILIPQFMVTFLVGAVGRTNLAYGTAANRRLATLMKPSDLSPRPLHIIIVAVRVERWHKRVTAWPLGLSLYPAVSGGRDILLGDQFRTKLAYTPPLLTTRGHDMRRHHIRLYIGMVWYYGVVE